MGTTKLPSLWHRNWNIPRSSRLCLTMSRHDHANQAGFDTLPDRYSVWTPYCGTTAVGSRGRKRIGGNGKDRFAHTGVLCPQTPHEDPVIHYYQYRSHYCVSYPMLLWVYQSSIPQANVVLVLCTYMIRCGLTSVESWLQLGS